MLGAPDALATFIATVMVVAHREIGTLMVVALYFLEDRRDGNLLLAVVFGNAAHLLYQYGVLDTAPQSRLEVTLYYLRLSLRAFIGMTAVYIMSMLSWYWVAVFLQKPARRELLVFVLAFIPAVLCCDFTRDYILLALPAVLFHAERLVLSRREAWVGKTGATDAAAFSCGDFYGRPTPSTMCCWNSGEIHPFRIPLKRNVDNRVCGWYRGVLGVRGCSSMVEQKLPKLTTRVQFPSPAPLHSALVD